MSEYNNTYMAMAPANPAVEAVKKTGSSPLFLVATITYTLMLLLSIVSAFMPSSLYTYANMYYEMTYDPSLYEVMAAMSSSMTIGALIGSLPTILTAIGLWMIYSASKTKNPRVSTGGFSLVSGVQIFLMVLICIALAITCIVMVAGSIAISEAVSYSSYYGMEAVASTATSAFLIVFALILLVFVLMIIYYVKLIGSIRTIKKAATGTVAGKNVSLYVIVMNFIVIGFSVISFLLSMVSFTFMNFLSSLFGLAFNLLITIVLIKMRGQLAKIAEENPQGTPAPEAPASTGAYENFNTEPVPVQPQAPQYTQPQQPQAPQYYGQPQQYQAPQYGQPQQYQAPQYGQPQQYQAPQYGQPQQYQAPQYGQPQQYQAPQYGQPQQYQAPQYGQPQQYQAPQYNQPQQYQAPQETDSNDPQ